jgi:Bacterial inner membrane protein
MHLLAFVAGLAASPADAAGFLAVAVGCSWALFRTRRRILLIQSFGAVAFAAHFFLLGSMTGALLCLVSLTQSLASTHLRSRRAMRVVYGASVVAILVTGLATWEGLPSLFAAVGSAFATLGRLAADPQRMRQRFLCCSLAWMGHNLLLRSPFGLTSDALNLAAILVGLWRGRRARRPRFSVRLAAGRTQGLALAAGGS